MIGIRLIDSENYELAAGIGRIGIRGHLETSYGRIAGGVGIIDIEVSVAVIIRVKGQPQKAPFAAVANYTADIQKRRRQDSAVFQNPDRTGLLDYENSPGISGGRGYENRRR